MLGRVSKQRAPATADIQMLVPWLHLDVLTDGLELALLRCLQTLFRVLEDSAGVHHGVTQEPIVEVVAAVVDVGDIGLVRLDAVGDVLPQELFEVELDVTAGEAKSE